MPTDCPPLPTKTELAILEVLWRLGPSTVRQVVDDLRQRRRTTYTTALKLLQIMFDKGLVTREEDGPRHVYSPGQPAEETRRRLVDDLLVRGFGGSAASLVLGALATGRASPEEIREIRRLLDEHGRQGEA